jgi:hypothetical protein
MVCRVHGGSGPCKQPNVVSALTMNEIVLRQTLCMMNIILDVIFE